MGVLWCIANHLKRVYVHIDNSNVFFAACRGKSPTESVDTIVAQAIHAAITARLIMFPCYVPSKLNCADYPSRGLPAPLTTPTPPVDVLFLHTCKVCCPEARKNVHQIIMLPSLFIARELCCLLPEGMLLKVQRLVDEGRLPPATFYVPTGHEEQIGTAWVSRSGTIVRGRDIPVQLRCSHVRPHATFYVRNHSGLQGGVSEVLRHGYHNPEME